MVIIKIKIPATLKPFLYARYNKKYFMTAEQKRYPAANGRAAIFSLLTNQPNTVFVLKMQPAPKPYSSAVFAVYFCEALHNFNADKDALMLFMILVVNISRDY